MRKGATFCIGVCGFVLFPMVTAFAGCPSYWTEAYKRMEGCYGSSAPTYAPPVYQPPVYQPSPAELKARQATALNNQGVALEKRGKYLEAIRLYELSLQLNPTQVTHHNLAHANNELALQYYKAKNFSQALQYFRQAKQNNPSDTVISNNLWSAQYEFDNQQHQAQEQADLNRAQANIVAKVLGTPGSSVSSAPPPPASFEFADTSNAQAMAGSAAAPRPDAGKVSNAGEASSKVNPSAGAQANGAPLDFMNPAQPTAGTGGAGSTNAFGTASVNSNVLGPADPPRPQTKYVSASAQADAAAKDPNCVFDGRPGCKQGQALVIQKPSAASAVVNALVDRIAKNPKLITDEQFQSRFGWYRQLDGQLAETKSKIAVIQQQIDSGKGDKEILAAQKGTLQNTAKQIKTDQATAKGMMDERAKTLSVSLDWPEEAPPSPADAAPKPTAEAATKPATETSTKK